MQRAEYRVLLVQVVVCSIISSESQYLTSKRNFSRSFNTQHSAFLLSGLYLHIPFCKQRCVYCDFYFVTSRKLVSDFSYTLKQEIEYQGTHFGPKLPLDTIYFGGGTPSLLAPDNIQELLEVIDRFFDTSRVQELSFELNPDDVDDAYLKALRQTGINRLSIGVQSFFQEDLQWMHRAHSDVEAGAIVDLARSAGFDNFSVDLIFGLPHQHPDTWLANLKRALSLDIPHLSTYSLTVEPRTPLHKQVSTGKQARVDDQTLADLYQQTMDVLRAANYEHYEVSSFAKPGFRSRHNQLYWQHTNYIGVGPAAHSFWWGKNRSDEPALRQANISNLKQYLASASSTRPPDHSREEISPADLASEYVMLRLRTRDGLDLATLFRIYAATIEEPTIQRLIDEGLATRTSADVLQLTDQGLMVCDAITSTILGRLETTG